MQKVLKFKRKIQVPFKIRKGTEYVTIGRNTRVYKKTWKNDNADWNALKSGDVFSRKYDINAVYRKADRYFLYITGQECTCEIREKIQREEAEAHKYFLL